jgi:hypothetical protein
MKKHIDKHKQKELEIYLKSYNPDFDRLISLVKMGIKDTVNKTDKPIIGAFREGLYLGAPGKDIYLALPLLDETQLKLLAKELSDCYPMKSPKGHVGYAACIRYIYGCFDKQGCLLSQSKLKMMIAEKEDWSLPDIFTGMLNDFFIKKNCYYGQIIYNEMKGHRTGDIILIEKNYKLQNVMLNHYNTAQVLACKAKSWKHTFTPFYWAASYLEKYNIDLAIEYHVKNIKMMEKFCPDARPGYREKAIHSLSFLRKKMLPKEWASMSKWLKKCKNKCIKKIKMKFLK